MDTSCFSPINDVEKWMDNIQGDTMQSGTDITLNYTPKLNLEFDSEEVAYDFYNEYARMIGFGIRRDYRNISKKDGVLTSRRFSCCKKGERGPDKRDHLTKKPRAETRTGMEARMIVSLDRKINKYKVTDFIADHNHLLQPPACIHKVRSHRSISESQASFINGKRQNESDAEYESIHKLPRMKMKKAPMLIQAAQVYTPRLFEEFQEDYEEYQGAYIKECKQGESMHEYIVANVDGSKERLVAGDPLKQVSLCDCCKFETHDVLCSHAIKVLDIMNIKSIPQHYILKRWTRDARDASNKDWKGQHIELDRKAHFTNRFRELCPRMVKLTNRASESHETYTFLSKVVEESSKIVEKMLAKKYSLDKESSVVGSISISITDKENQNNVNVVDCSGPKGIKKRESSCKGKQRPKSWVEKLARKRKGSIERKRKEDSTKKNKMKENLGTSITQSVTTVEDMVKATKYHTFTQLLTEPLDYNSLPLCTDNPIDTEHSQANCGAVHLIID